MILISGLMAGPAVSRAPPPHRAGAWILAQPGAPHLLDIAVQTAYPVNQDHTMRWPGSRPTGGEKDSCRSPIRPQRARRAAAATRMSDDTVTDLLERLSSGRVDAAWSEFLARYSPLIMHVIRRHDADDDRATECFNHVCGALSDDGFRRLLSFRPDGPARFKTWLMAVVSNLCVDWRRKEQGRVRPPQCVSRLPELDQQVYRCIYVRACRARTACRLSRRGFRS